MPIKPENKKLYPKDWKALSKRIREEAGQRCEFCFAKNYQLIQRGERGEIADTYGVIIDYQYSKRLKGQATRLFGGKWSIVVLTVAHLNHDPTDNRRCNLRALCQRCHSLLDAPHRTINAAKTREEKQTNER